MSNTDPKDLIKIHRSVECNGQIAGEWFWAKKLTENTAEVNNIPFFCDLNLGDVVKFRPQDNEVTGIIKVGSHTVAIQYPFEDITVDVLRLRWEKIVSHFRSHEIHAEGAMPGFAVLAVPLDMPFPRFMEIANQCPVPLDLGGYGVTDDEENED